jgi:hypothetical protein
VVAYTGGTAASSLDVYVAEAVYDQLEDAVQALATSGNPR